MTKPKTTSDLFKKSESSYMDKKVIFDEWVSQSAAKLKLAIGEEFIGKYVGTETFHDPKLDKEFTLVIFDDNGATYAIAGHKILSTFTKRFDVSRGTLCAITRLPDLEIDGQPESFSDMKDYRICFEQGAQVIEKKKRNLTALPDNED